MTAVRAWFAADDGGLRGVTECTSISRAVGRFVAWKRGREVLSAPAFLRATTLDGCTVTVRVREDRLPAVRDRFGGHEFVTVDPPTLTIEAVTAVEAVLDRYPDTFERLFRETDHDLCLRVRGGEALRLDGELVSVSA